MCQQFIGGQTISAPLLSDPGSAPARQEHWCILDLTRPKVVILNDWKEWGIDTWEEWAMAYNSNVPMAYFSLNRLLHNKRRLLFWIRLKGFLTY